MGLSGVVVDYAVFVPLVAWAALDPRLAALVAFLGAVSWNYALNRRVTFAHGRDAPLGRSYVSFVTLCAVGAAIRVGVIHLLMVTVLWTRPPEIYVSSFLGIVVATAWNFLGSKLIAFRPSRT